MENACPFEIPRNGARRLLFVLQQNNGFSLKVEFASGSESSHKQELKSI